MMKTAMTDTPDPASACANCGAAFSAFTATRPTFCPHCGQETRIRPPRVAEFIQQFGGAYFATEGALWRTLKLLLLKPGELTRQYLAGRRKHYVLPLRLYLSISVLVLLLMRASAAIQFNVADADMPKERPRNAVFSFGMSSAGLKDGVFFCDNLPQCLCKRVQRRLDVDPAQLRVEVEALGDRFIGNIGAAMFVLLPGFALWMRLAYRSRRLRYTEHLVFALHVHAFWFVMLAATASNVSLLAFVAMLAVPIYTLLAMRRVFGGRWWPRLLRAALVSLLYGITMAFALTGVAVWAMLF